MQIFKQQLKHDASCGAIWLINMEMKVMHLLFFMKQTWSLAVCSHLLWSWMNYYCFLFLQKPDA